MKATSSPRAMRFALLVIGVSAGLLLSEPVVRLFFPPQSVVLQSPQAQSFQDLGVPSSLDVSTPSGPRMRANSHVTIHNHLLNGRTISVQTNQFGFRGSPIRKKAPGDYRILVLGDSITFGDYLQEDETFTARMERALRRWRPGTQVINGGKPGSDLRTQLHIFLESGLSAEPDLILVASYLNDGTETEYLRPLTGWLSHSALAVKIHEIVGRRQIVDGLRKRVAKRLGRTEGPAAFPTGQRWMESHQEFTKLQEWAVYDWGFAWHEQCWSELRPYYAELKRITDSRGIQLAVALFPVVYQVRASWSDDRPQQMFRSLMRELAIPHLDILPYLRRDAGKMPLYYDHCHLTPAGNRVVGDLLASFLDVRGLMGSPQE